MLCFSFCMLSMKVFSPGTCWHVTSMFLFWSYHGHKFTELCIYQKKRNSKILRKYLATNMHQYMMVILSSWDLFALLSRNRTIAATMLCRVYTHVWSPIKVNYVDIKSSRSTENPEGFLHPPSLGIPTTLLSSLHCHHSTKLHTNTLTITQQMHKSATEKYGKMQKYKYLPKPKLHRPLRPPMF